MRNGTTITEGGCGVDYYEDDDDDDDVRCIIISVYVKMQLIYYVLLGVFYEVCLVELGILF